MKAAIVLILFLVGSVLFVVLLDRWIRRRPERDASSGANDFSGGSDGGFGSGGD